MWPQTAGRAGDTEALPIVTVDVSPSPPRSSGRAGDTDEFEAIAVSDQPTAVSSATPNPHPLSPIPHPPSLEPTFTQTVTKGIGFAAIILMVGNILSRVLGLVREQTAAYLFDPGTEIAAFTIADNIHTMLFDLVISGMMQAALIPVLSQYTAPEKREELRRITGALMLLAMLTVGSVVVLLEFFAPAAVNVMTSLGGGEAERGQEVYDLTVTLVRWILPAVFLLAISTILMSMLFALQRFTLPSLSLSLRNVAIVATALALGRSAFGIRSMALGIVLGALLLIVVQLPGLRDAMPKLNFGFGHPAIRRIGLLYLPIFIGLFANTVALIVDRNLAWGVGDDALAAMRYATTLNQMVLGLVAAAISLASLPALSRLYAAGEMDGYWETLARGLRMVTVLVVPATFGLAVLSWPSVRLLFEHGATDRDAAVQILIALLAYLPGTLFAAFDQVLIFAYYARQNTKTPQTVGVIAVGIYFIFALTLVQPFGMSGLVAANSAQFIFHTVVMIVLVRKLMPPGMTSIDGGRLRRTFFICTSISVWMAAIAGTFAWLLATRLPDTANSLGHLVREVSVVGLPAAVGAVIYAVGTLYFRIEEAEQIQRRVLGLVRRG